MKGTAERALVFIGLPAVSRLSRRDDILILAYHNVVPAGVVIEGDRSLHLPQDAFAAHLDLLQQTHDVLPLDAIFASASASHPRPRAIITFDDAYRGAVTLGIREVVSRGLPATIFVCPAFIGGRFFWWDAMTQAGTHGPTESFRQRALDEYRGADAAVRRWADTCGYQARPLPDHAACASAEELEAASAQPGITLASHSWSHRNLLRLSTMELEEELTRPLHWLSERFEKVLPVFSYPYGLSSPAIESAVAAVGYRAAVLVHGGWTSRQPRNLFAVPRWNVPAGVSRNGFLLRTAGLFCQ